MSERSEKDTGRGRRFPPSLATGFESVITQREQNLKVDAQQRERRGIKGMGNIRHKWMALVVAVVTTFATAQEAVKQYDGLREQANEWATSTLLASLLNTSAPGEELIEAQTASSYTCSVEAGREEQPARRQIATLATYQLIETKSPTALQRDEAIHIADNETTAPFDAQRFELSDANTESFERQNEVAFLADKNHVAELEVPGQTEEVTAERVGAPEEHDADSIVDTQTAMHLANRLIAQTPPPRVSETDIAAVRVRAAADARVQWRAARRALKVLQERTGPPVKFEMKIIRKGDQTSAAATMLRAANCDDRLDAPAEEGAEDELPAQLALRDIGGTSPQSAASDE